MIPKNLLSSGTALFYIVVDAGLLPINALGCADPPELPEELEGLAAGGYTGQIRGAV
jgi:hypothetical protein